MDKPDTIKQGKQSTQREQQTHHPPDLRCIGNVHQTIGWAELPMFHFVILYMRLVADISCTRTEVLTATSIKIIVKYMIMDCIAGPESHQIGMILGHATLSPPAVIPTQHIARHSSIHTAARHPAVIAGRRGFPVELVSSRAVQGTIVSVKRRIVHFPHLIQTSGRINHCHLDPFKSPSHMVTMVF